MSNSRCNSMQIAIESASNDRTLIQTIHQQLPAASLNSALQEAASHDKIEHPPWTIGCPLSNDHHSSNDYSSSASVLIASFSKMLEILAIQNICLRTSYMGISTFSMWFHVEYQLQASNRLHQNAEVRNVRAHPDATPPNEHQYARSHRSSMNWWRNCTLRELKNRYLLCHEE